MSIIKSNASAIQQMKISIDITLNRPLSDGEYDRLESAGISVYGECKPSKTPRYELRCHDGKELAFAEAFLRALK